MASTPIFIDSGPERRRIAVLARHGDGPEVVWLGGFRSEMTATKASHLDGWAERAGRAFVRFDYSGHGQSPGRFEDGTISTWTEDARAVIESRPERPMVLVGSSMGGWIALLLALVLKGTPRAPAGLVLLAPAPDFTERLMWPRFTGRQRAEILERGATLIESAYGPPYPVTRALMEDGRRNTLLDRSHGLGCPVHILQGTADPDVPLSHAHALVECLPSDPVTLTTIRDGDHRLSRPEDLAMLERAVEGIGR